jgi:hypothetical protein
MVGDLEGTKKLCEDQVPIIREEYEVMFIPQGIDVLSVFNCIDWMADRWAEEEAPRHWGIPRWMANTFGSRTGFINYINNYARGEHPVSIHLLGMSNYYHDDIACCKTLSVTGIDSANPLVLGFNNFDMHTSMHIERGDYWEAPTLTKLMASNVRKVHSDLCS